MYLIYVSHLFTLTHTVVLLTVLLLITKFNVKLSVCLVRMFKHPAYCNSNQIIPKGKSSGTFNGNVITSCIPLPSGFPPRIVDEFLVNNHAVTHLWDGAAHDQHESTCQGKKNATPLNGEQVEAIRRSLVNRFQLIQGPPGEKVYCVVRH